MTWQAAMGRKHPGRRDCLRKAMTVTMCWVCCGNDYSSRGGVWGMRRKALSAACGLFRAQRHGSFRRGFHLISPLLAHLFFWHGKGHGLPGREGTLLNTA